LRASSPTRRRKPDGRRLTVDEAIYDLPRVIAGIASELTSSGPAFEPFHKLHATYMRDRSELENGPQAPEGTPSFLTTTAVRIGLAAARGIPVAGGVLTAVDDAAVAEQADRLRKYISTKFRSTEIRLRLSPAEALTPVFVEGIQTDRMSLSIVPPQVCRCCLLDRIDRVRAI
jgi:hypothetical protein